MEISSRYSTGISRLTFGDRHLFRAAWPSSAEAPGLTMRVLPSNSFDSPAARRTLLSGGSTDIRYRYSPGLLRLTFGEPSPLQSIVAITCRGPTLHNESTTLNACGSPADARRTSLSGGSIRSRYSAGLMPLTFGDRHRRGCLLQRQRASQ
jgi:hypothetical protein